MPTDEPSITDDLGLDEIITTAIDKVEAVWKKALHAQAEHSAGLHMENLRLGADLERQANLYKLARDRAEILSKRITQAQGLLRDMTDGGEECRGRDTEIGAVMLVLEGRIHG